MNRKQFLGKYNLPEDALEQARLQWNSLLEIVVDHSNRTVGLETTARFIAEHLRQVPEVHSLKYRVKDPEHLMEKIIRKKLEDKSLEISVENYREEITDLIGVRALHLFKEDWIPIHRFITTTWNLGEPPTANIRKGDSEELLEQFRKFGCEINEHKYGYRSVHYLVESQLAKERIVAEVQVRTIFEEGWSEIDHQTRYPYNVDNVILGALLSLFNRLAGSADEMGTFINFLKKELEARDAQHETQLKELIEKIEKLEIDSKKKQELQKQVDRLTLPYTLATTAALQAVRQASLTGNIEAMLQAIRNVEINRSWPKFVNPGKQPEVEKTTEAKADSSRSTDAVTTKDAPTTSEASTPDSSKESSKPRVKKRDPKK